MPEIGGEYFPEKMDNMTLVDAYYIPDEEVEDYIFHREKYAEILLEAFKEKYNFAERAFQGSQDGEAVIGLDEKEDLMNLIHLDPMTIEDMKVAEKENKLKEYLDYIIEG